MNLTFQQHQISIRKAGKEKLLGMGWDADVCYFCSFHCVCKYLLDTLISRRTPVQPTAIYLPHLLLVLSVGCLWFILFWLYPLVLNYYWVYLI